MKELNIIEASNMPVGTEFEVIINGNKYCCVAKILKSKDTGVKELVWDNRANTQIFITDSILNAKFIPIQKPVSFDYAISKGLEGKRIKVDVTKLNEEYSDEYTCVLNNAWNNVYYSIERIFEMLSKATYRKEIIKEGEWHVED